jgi:SAM-dependent methyltransferase
MDKQPQQFLLSDPVSFWEQRHARSDAWRSGGDRGLSPEENFEFYAYRLGRVVELVRRHGGPDRPLRILDAGCGRGHFTDGLTRCGHRVTGIDSSETAVEWARGHYGPYFELSELSRYRPAQLFDVMLCIDVLFHVLDDDAWRRALEAFARYARAEATMIFTDALGPQRFPLGNYIIHRSRDEYQSALADSDFELVETMPYAFGSNPNQFVVCRRRVG